MIIGYARVSTKDQSLDIQREELKSLGCRKIFEEKVSGKSTNNRDQLKAAIDYAREGDTFIVTKLDRLARDTIDALKAIDALTDKGVHIKIMDIGGGADLTTDTGRLLLTVLSAVAEMERKRINERTQAGIQKAREEGVKFGRKVNDDNKAKVLELKKQGMKPAAIARELGIGRTSVYRYLGNLNEA